MISDDTKPRVLLTNPIQDDAQKLLSDHCHVIVAPDTSPAVLRELVIEAEGLIVRAQLPQDIFEQAPRLRAVVRHGVGLDMIPVDEATKRKIPVANVPGSNTAAVVEYCLAAMLHHFRHLSVIEDTLRSQGWSSARTLGNDGLELSGSTCGIVGVGRIGSSLARALTALGVRVIGLGPHPQKFPDFVSATDKETLFRTSDIVVLCCPLNDETRGLVGEAMLRLMRDRALLINVARGAVIDSTAVVSALRTGRLGGAVMDVYDRQPLTGTEPVFGAPKLLLTPHVAGITRQSMHRMSHESVTTMLRLLSGEVVDSVVNPSVFE